jgi:hypothetical protein
MTRFKRRIGAEGDWSGTEEGNPVTLGSRRAAVFLAAILVTAILLLAFIRFVFL